MFAKVITFPSVVLEATDYGQWWTPHQFHRAWAARKGMEVGGLAHPDAVTAFDGLNLKTKTFVGLMATGITAYLVTGGKPVIDSLYGVGKKMAEIGILIPEGGLTNPKEGIPLKDGTTATLPLGLLDWGCYQHHLYWMAARRLTMQFPGELQQPERPEHIFWDNNTPEKAWDPDRLNFLMLGAAIYSAPESRLQELLGMVGK